MIRRGLALCGGGFNGVAEAVILGALEDKLQTPLSHYFDCIGGTSTGAILTALLVCPNLSGPWSGLPKYPAHNLAAFYLKESPRIFPDTYLRTFDPLRLINPRYPSSGIEGTLQDYLSTTKCYEALTRIVIPSYDRSTSDIRFFNRSSPELLWQAARASSAAPTYFPEFALDWHRYQDGGLADNDPSMSVYLDLLTAYPTDELSITTITCGTWPDRASGTPAPKPLLQGGLGEIGNLLNGLVSTPMTKTHEYMKLLASANRVRYSYINPVFPNGPGEIDDISQSHFDLLQSGALAEWKKWEDKF